MEVTMQLVMAEPIQFPGGTQPANARGRPEIIVFLDGSMQAFLTTLYIRWRISGDPTTWSTSFLTDKPGWLLSRASLQSALSCAQP